MKVLDDKMFVKNMCIMRNRGNTRYGGGRGLEKNKTKTSRIRSRKAEKDKCIAGCTLKIDISFKSYN